MAAAAIRHAARRMIGGGALPRTVHPKRKPLVNTSATKQQVQPPQGGQQGLTAEKKIEAAVRMALIDTKMEELYNHIAGFKTKYTLRGSEAQKHTSLMNELSEHVKPGPDDPLWRSCRRSARINDYVKQAAAFFIAFVITDASYHWYNRDRNP
uniref:Uncharacterized protein n=1 Tax=Avena sativa TaxID=4498 RepID=A0ACD6AGW2_AVESA